MGVRSSHDRAATAGAADHSRLHGSLVGRARELHRLRTAFVRACEGRGGVVTVCGDPGIGKTRLLDEIARETAAAGARVLIGRCYEATDAPALWPWRQILEAYLADPTTSDDIASARADLAAVAELWPDLREQLGVNGKAWFLEPERARFRGFRAISHLLKAGARRRPLVILLEDLHCGDPATLRLLEFFAREIAESGVLVAASHRDEIDDAHPLAAALPVLATTLFYDAIRVAPLDEPEADVLVASASGPSVTEAVRRTIVRRGDGNPFFLLELVRGVADELQAEMPHAGNGHAAGSRADGDVPRGVCDLIGRRLERIGADCRELLMVAAAIGREFEVRELETAAVRDRRDVLNLLEEARNRRIVVEVGPAPGRYRFAHALIRDFLYERIRAAEKADLHWRIGTAFETLHADSIERYLPEIADHFVRGALAADAGKAFHYALAAGREAMRRYAHEDAIKQLERALSLWDLDSKHEETARVAVLLELGTARQRAGEPDAARLRFRDALGAALALRAKRVTGAAELVARAALFLADGWGVMGVFDAEIEHMLVDAAGGLDGDSPLLARVLARRAVAHYWRNDSVALRDELSAHALEMARRSSDYAALGYTLNARHFAIMGPDRLDEALAISDEAVALGELHRDTELALGSRYWRFMDRLTCGDLAGARSDLREYTRRADEIRHPHFLWYSTVPLAALALIEGRLDDAQELSMRALELGRHANALNADQYFGIQTFMLARFTGTEESLLEPVRALTERLPGIPAWRAALALLFAATGHRAEAARELERLAADDFAGVLRDVNFTVCCALMSETCAVLRDRALARRLYEMLLPYSARHVIIAAAAHVGVVSHYLGLLSHTFGSTHRADEWFADAQERYESVGASAHIVRVMLDRAAALRERTSAGDKIGVTAFAGQIERAHALASALGLHAFVRKAEALAAAGVGGDSDTGGAPAAPARACVLRHEGEYWSVFSENQVARIKDAKGMRYLVELLRAPARDFHVAELISAGTWEPPGVRNGGGAPAGNAGPILDRRAKTEYRERIATLRTDLAEAEANRDLGRVEQLRVELEVVTDALSGALGIGGRDRRAADDAERARLNVTRALRAAIRRIAVAHPQLGRHLSRNVRTGRYCRYDFDPNDGIRWHF